jgi:hypothetical protein
MKRADAIIPEILLDATVGAFKGMKALAGTAAASIQVGLPNGSRGGDRVKVPYFDILGEFEDLPDDEGGAGNLPKLTPQKLTMSADTAVVRHSGKAFETSVWAQLAAKYADPYAEAARQLAIGLQRRADRALIEEALTTDLSMDVYNFSTPRRLDYDLMVDARALWGDEDADIALAVCHSKVRADLLKQKDGQGRPLFLDATQGQLTTVGGVPIIASDRAPIDFPNITATGTTPPAVTVSGRTTLAVDRLRVEVTTGGARGTAVVRYSFDGGATYAQSAVLTAATVQVLTAQGDPTGLTLNFATGTYATDNLYVGTPRFTTLVAKRNALVVWMNDTPTVKSFEDVLADSEQAALHVYWCAHRYRKVNGTTRTGVVALRHN